LYPQALMILGGLVTAFSFFSFAVRFSTADEQAAEEEFQKAMARRREEVRDRVPIHDLIPGIRHLRPMDALRIYLGVALMVKGVYFIMNMAELEGTLGEGLGQGQTMIAWSVVFAHLVGGASLVLGFVTRVAAAANALILLGAMIVSLAGATEGSVIENVDFQFTAYVFFSLVLLVWRGSGPLSLDHLARLDAEKEPEIL
jgi:uncharacterized membrane protein YphA (DoxX/SURF4 family)